VVGHEVLLLRVRVLGQVRESGHWAQLARQREALGRAERGFELLELVVGLAAQGLGS
jgi:hypothetical protein